jgi:hypothetical protein
MQVAAPVTFTKDTPDLMRLLPGNTQHSKETDIHATAQWIKLRKAGQNSSPSTPMKRLKICVRSKRKFPGKENVTFMTVWFDLFPVQHIIRTFLFSGWERTSQTNSGSELVNYFRSQFNSLSELIMKQRNRGK